MSQIYKHSEFRQKNTVEITVPQKRRGNPQYKLNTFFNEGGKQTRKRRRAGET